MNTYRGQRRVDLREYYQQNGEWKPGRKGISLSAAEWEKLKALVAQVDEELKAN